MRHALAALAVLSATGCDSSGSGGVASTPLVGTYTLIADGLGTSTGTAYGAYIPPFRPDVPTGSVQGRTTVDVPGADGIVFIFDAQTIGLTAGLYRVARTDVVDPVDGCGGAAQSSESGDAFVTVSVDSGLRSCVAAVVGGEVEVVSSAESDVRMRYSFVAVPAAGAGLPDTVRVTGTFALAAASR